MNRRAFVAIASAIATLSALAPARAADTLPLSSLKPMPGARDRTEPDEKAPAVPGITVKERPSNRRTLFELFAATPQGYCFAHRDTPSQLSSSVILYDLAPGNVPDLLRFVEADGTARLERTRIGFDAESKKAWSASKTSVDLRAVSRADGVTVWGYRDGAGDAVLVARGASGGRELRAKAEESTFTSSDCAWGSIRLEAAASRAGAIAELRGTLPPVGEGKAKVTPQFVVNGSLAKVARESEPVLAVRVRRID